MIHFLLVLTVFAATQVGNFRFTVPQGWKVTNVPGGQVVLEPPGVPPGNCSVILQPAQPLTGELRAWMERANAAYLAGARLVEEQFTETTVGGHPALTWSAVIDGSSGRVSIYVVAAQVNGNAEVVIFGANDPQLFQKYLPEVKNLVKSISFEKPKLDGLEGVYWRFKQRPNFDGTMTWSTTTDYMAFSGDGRVLWGLPEGGLPACFARPDAATSPKFGRYQITSDGISITYNPDPYIGKVVTQIAMKGKEGIQVDGHLYRALPKSNGLVLDGRYVRKLMDGEAEIVFTKDGRFSERGLRYAGFITDEMIYPDRPRLPENGGSGRYSIQNNTLTLHYDGGPTKNIFFFTTDDPANVKTIVVNTYGYVR